MCLEQEPPLVNGVPKLEDRHCPDHAAPPTARGPNAAGSEKPFQMGVLSDDDSDSVYLLVLTVQHAMMSFIFTVSKRIMCT